MATPRASTSVAMPEPVSDGGVMVDRYTEWADWTVWTDEAVDRRPRQRSGAVLADGNPTFFLPR